jgi:2-succinyl-5-enolpyruvyl-6-hydroxy-3-cyclohexene-1-carboxylate synthase
MIRTKYEGRSLDLRVANLLNDAQTQGLNYLAAAVVVEELYRHGIRDFILSPGARSAPLALAIARHPGVNTTVVLDERSAAFYALGISKFNRIPAVLICTSGSAGAHYLPAVIEASHSEIPLIVITADRPYELHYTGSNQTVEQEGFYGNFVECVRTIPPVVSPDDLTFVLRTISAVLQASRAAKPVHLNFQFRTPLIASSPEPISLPVRFRQWLEGGEPLCTYSTDSSSFQLDADIVERLTRAQRGLVIAGSIDSPSEQLALRHFVEAIQWPCLIEKAAGVTASYPHVVPLLPQEAVTGVYGFPDLVVHFGRLPTNASSLGYLTSQTCPCIQVGSSDQRQDPSGFVTHRVCGSVDEVAPLIARYLGESALLTEFKALRVLYDSVVQGISQDPSFSEIQVLNSTLSQLPPDTTLYVGNSLPIRLINLAAATESNVVVGAHRGASGIDGTLAITAGWARSSLTPVVLLVGDLTFIHDHASLGLLSEVPVCCTVVVINNGGGRIFDTLPTLNQSAEFESLFLTPQKISIEGIASLYEVPYTCVGSPESLTLALKESRLTGGLSIIEARVNGDVTARLIEEFYSRYSQQ